MVMARVLQVCVGTARPLRLPGGRTLLSGIGKAPVAGTVMARALGLDGDEQADLNVHGGLQKAVYAYPSEHMAFWQAYVLAAAACIGLQFVYLSGVLRGWWRAGAFATMLTALYGALYSLLVSEDNALLMGSLLLFGILAVVMLVTRRIDWYERSATLG